MIHGEEIQMKKIIILAGVLLCAMVALSGCTKRAAGGDGLKIAMVSSSGIDDGGFTQDCYAGITEFIKQNPGATVRTIKEPDMGKLLDATAQIVADYDVLVLPGFNFAPIGDVAANNPDTRFILVDTAPTRNGAEVTLPNVYGMLFKEQESGFYAGLAAALETKSGKVAVVNGMAFPTNVNYQYGFMAGVTYSNKHYGTKAECVELPSYAGTDVTGANVKGNYIGGFADQPTGKVVGNALINQGVDIIFVAAGDSGLGVFAAAKEAGIRVVGVDVDQYDGGANGATNIVLTSALKVMNINVTRQLEAIAAGTFEGKNEVLDAATDSTGFVGERGRHQLSETSLARLGEVAKLLKNGDIVPPSNFSSGITTTSFPGL
jgi:basic membrane protein A